MSETLPEPLTGCACRWDSSDKRVATCERHLGWLDAVGEWSDRAFASEAHAAKLCAARDAEIERLTLERDVNKRMRDQHFAELATLRAAAAQASIASNADGPWPMEWTMRDGWPFRRAK